MNFNISYELKLEVLNAVRKRNLMFAKWIDLCSTIAFIVVAIFALFDATSLEDVYFANNEYILNTITIATVILSLCFDFIFKSDKYKENTYLVNDILKQSNSSENLNRVFEKLIPLIDELDIARARNDYCKKLKALDRLNTQKDEDRLQPVDIVLINRQRYIIIVLLVEIILFIGMFIVIPINSKLLYLILLTMVFIGCLFMIIDANGEKRAIKQVEEIYKN